MAEPTSDDSAARDGLGASERDELRRLRKQARDQRERVVVLTGLLLSLLVHTLLTLGGNYWSRLNPEPPPEETERTARLRFLETPPAPEPETPPDTQNISERDQEAHSPEPSELEGDEPELPAPVPQVEKVQAPPAEPQEQQEPQPEAPPEPVPDRRARMREALEKMRSTPLSTDLPQQPGGLGGAQAPGQPTFESNADVDWGPYAARIKPIVRRNWRIPVAATLGVEGAVEVHFYIACDGSIEELEYSFETETLALNQAAFDAIRLSDRLPPPPLPPEYCEERVGVTWLFIYGLDGGELRHWYRQRALAQRRGS